MIISLHIYLWPRMHKFQIKVCCQLDAEVALVYMELSSYLVENIWNWLKCLCDD
jgi:hypothetical protein